MKLVSLFLYILLAVSLAGCGGYSHAENISDNYDDAVTINFFGNKYEKENVRRIEEYLAEFTDKNPHIRVTYESIKGTAYYDALMKRMATGNGDDVFMIDHDSMLKLRDEGKLADLSDLPVVDNYNAVIRDQIVEPDGSVYRLPTTISMFAMYCNLDLLKKHHQPVPQNLTEFEAVCQYFVDQGITPIVANDDISLKTMATGIGFAEVYMHQQAGDTMERLNKGEVPLSHYLSPGYQVVEQFIQKGYVNGAVALKTAKTKDDLQEFAQGNSPFMLTGAWAAGRLKVLKPSFQFKLYPLPILPQGSMLVINPDIRLAVNAHSKYKQEAIKFVEFFTEKDRIRDFANSQYSISPLQDRSSSKEDVLQPLVQAFNDGLLVIGSDAHLQLPIWAYGKEISRKLLEGESLQQVMAELDEKVAGDIKND